MHKPRNDFLDRMTYLALRLIASLLHIRPIEQNLSLMRRIGSVIYFIDRRHRERAQLNLRYSFPGMDDARRNRLARQSLQQLAMLCVEVLFTTRLIRIDTWRRYVELKNFRPTLELLMARKQPVIMVTGHYGNWEVLGYVLATLGFQTTTVARPLDNPYVSDLVYGMRTRRGQRIVDKTGAMQEVASELANGGVVCFVADQNAGSKGLFVDFFGRPASTYKSIALLAIEYNVPIVVGYARRINRRFRFEIEIAAQDIIYPADWKDQPNQVMYITQRYTTAIESFIREDPSQYLWIHRRWKSRPKDEPVGLYA
jgi:KDO2-lipid IV(A) lauroyltransferase